MASCLRKSLFLFLVCAFVYGCHGGMTLLDDDESDYGHVRYKRAVGVQPGLNITRFHIESNVTSRFTTTTVVMIVYNPTRRGKTATVSINMPKNAFMTNFTMEANGYIYTGEVKTKEEALRLYNIAKGLDQSTGHVYKTSTKPKSRYASLHEASITVKPCQQAIFTLRYQEFLERVDEYYTNMIFVDPGRVVQDFRIIVNINETRGIDKLRVPEIMNTDLLDPDSKMTQLSNARLVYMHDNKMVSISYEPPAAAQEKYVGTINSTARFEVLYDVIREKGASDLLLPSGDGYFVHFYSTDGLPNMAKRIVFALDVSGSMWGRRIQQVKKAMRTIIKDLRTNDEFNIIKFSSGVTVWKSGAMVSASDANKAEATRFIDGLTARGMTNIHSALIRAVKLIDLGITPSLKTFNVITLLTDGHANVGVYKTNELLVQVASKNKDNYPIFTIGFGSGADFDLLLQIARENEGLATQIYEDSDAHLQLEKFYENMGNPTIRSLNLQYFGNVNPSKTIKNINKGATLFSGQEAVVTGTLLNPLSNKAPRIHVIGYSANSYMNMDLQPRRVDSGLGIYKGFTERLWAFLTVRKLTNDMKTANQTEKEKLKKRATELALKYVFVTDFTSMVVTYNSSKRVDASRQIGRSPPSHAQPNMAQQKTAIKPTAVPDTTTPPTSTVTPVVKQITTTPTSRRSRPIRLGRCTAIRKPNSMIRPLRGGQSVPKIPVIEKGKIVVSLPGSRQLICAPADDVTEGVYNLLTDTSINLEVRGQYIKEGSKIILDRMAIKWNTGRLEITTQTIQPPGSPTYTWNNYGIHLRGEAEVTVQCNHNLLRILLNNGTWLIVGKISNYLYFYIKNASNLPSSVTGLNGQLAFSRVSLDGQSLKYYRPSGCSGTNALPLETMVMKKRLLAKIKLRRIYCLDVEKDLWCNLPNIYKVDSLVL